MPWSHNSWWFVVVSTSISSLNIPILIPILVESILAAVQLMSATLSFLSLSYYVHAVMAISYKLYKLRLAGLNWSVSHLRAIRGVNVFTNAPTSLRSSDFLVSKQVPVNKPSYPYAIFILPYDLSLKTILSYPILRPVEVAQQRCLLRNSSVGPQLLLSRQGPPSYCS